MTSYFLPGPHAPRRGFMKNQDGRGREIRHPTLQLTVAKWGKGVLRKRPSEKEKKKGLFKSKKNLNSNR